MINGQRTVFNLAHEHGLMTLDSRSAELARVKAAYQIVFGHPIPHTVYHTHEPGQLAKRLDRAIRDMKPLDEFKPPRLAYPNQHAGPAPLPLSIRALIRWRHMQRH